MVDRLLTALAVATVLYSALFVVWWVAIRRPRLHTARPVVRVALVTLVGSGGSGGGDCTAHGWTEDGYIYTAHRLNCSPPSPGVDFLIFRGTAYRRLHPDEPRPMHHYFASDGSRWVEMQRPVKEKAL